MLTILGAMATWERETIGERTGEEGVPTKRGGAWYASTVRNALKLAS